MSDKVCTRCKQRPPAAKQRWCRECFNDQRRALRRKDAPPRAVNECETCGASLEGKRRHARFCSTACNMKAWHTANPQAQRGYWVKNAYGVTADEYARLVEMQDGKCAICGRAPEETNSTARTALGTFNVDHDHKTGAVRGLLCSPCNSGLARFDDDPQRLLAAAAYLAG